MRVVSFFAGCGGLDLGFEQAGFHVVWANELEQSVRETYIKNHPNTEFVLGDINRIPLDIIPDCDGFIGGPPCQSWSIAGKQRGINDERGKLFLTYIELIKAKKPKFFLIENVKGILDEKFGQIFQDFINRLDGAGYDVQWQLLDSVNYMIPQNRERIFIIGFRKDLNVKYIFPRPTCTKAITLRQAIGDIIEEPIKYDGKSKIVPNPIRSNHDVLTKAFGPFYYRGNRRRGWDQPSFTLHATADNIQLHPSSPKMLFFGYENWEFQMDKIDEYRRLSVRECARIQTFPDSFVFYSENIKDAYRMIGNAVPPRMGKVLAESIKRALNTNVTRKHFVQTQQDNHQLGCTLVGYYKDKSQYELILSNLLYYVRSDGRKGSLFKEDCSTIPYYLLLHHQDEYSIFELEQEEPVLTEVSYLKSCGFDCNGERYLCFKLKNKRELSHELGITKPIFDKRCFAPYFKMLDEISK